SVTLSISASASNLSVGTHVATLWFANLNNGFTQSRKVFLEVLAAPAITSQPASQTVLEGTTVTFSIGTASNGTLSYQWRYDNGTYVTNLTDGRDLSGARTSLFTLNRVSSANVGAYSVVVSNAFGTATSTDALLSVVSITAPGISVETFYSFSGGNDGANPNGLLQASNGIFYGTAQNGGAHLAGTVFQIGANGLVS